MARQGEKDRHREARGDTHIRMSRICSPAADQALIGCGLRSVSPRTADIVEKYPSAFQTAVTKQIADEPVACVDDVVEVIAAAARAFIFKLEFLRARARAMPAFAGNDVCVWCRGAHPKIRPPCCNVGFHRECWLEWRLGAPDVCLGCRRSLAERAP